MTNWEKSCVEALVASPTAFALFKAKQKNKKHIDQYLNKIWPYKIIKKSNGTQLRKDSEFNKILRKVESLKDNYNEAISIEFDYPFLPKEKLITQIKSSFNEKFKVNKLFDSIVLEIAFYEEEGDIETQEFDMRVNDRSNLSTRLIRRISCLYRVNIRKVRLKLVGVDRHNKSIRCEFINQFLNSFNFYKLVNSKYKREYLGQNVGIEIEYNGCWQKYLYRHLNSSRYAVSFNSGIDGGNECMNKDHWNIDPRLRENRLRINGARGLNALYFLLESMKKDGCQIDFHSGMHYHIDLREKASISNDDAGVEKPKSRDILGELISKELIKDTFELEKNFESFAELREEFRYPTEFNTIEWRFGSACLNFTKLAIQILFSLHVTNVIFSENKKVDIEYLTFLSTLMTKTNF